MSQSQFTAKLIGPGFLLSALLGLLIATIQPAQSQTLTVLHSFSGVADGGTIFGSLIKDKAGNLYGTASWGGAQGGNCTYDWGYGTGCGTVFQLTPSGSSWSFNVIYTFAGNPDDAANPSHESLAIDRNGNLFGTTLLGGAFLCAGGPGCGSVFELKPSSNGWTETVFHSFTDINGAFWPDAGVVIDKQGNLYGTTFHGGYGYGTVYEITSSGTEKELYKFFGGADGGEPFGGLVFDKQGNLYGTTQYGGDISQCGGSGCGTVFKIAADGTESVLYSFAGGNDGELPWAGVTLDRLGNIYGTTWVGGGTGCGGSGCGTVFKLAPDGTETVIHSFDSTDGDGVWGGVILDGKGNLYGTTTYGGTYNSGTIYKLTPSGGTWKLSVLHTFNPFNLLDGGSPTGRLLLSNGILYGTTQGGGTYGRGTVFALSRR